MRSLPIIFLLVVISAGWMISQNALASSHWVLVPPPGKVVLYQEPSKFSAATLEFQGKGYEKVKKVRVLHQGRPTDLVRVSLLVSGGVGVKRVKFYYHKAKPGSSFQLEATMDKRVFILGTIQVMEKKPKVKPRVRIVKPNPVRLTAGDNPVEMELHGTGLDQLGEIKVLYQGQATSWVKVYLGTGPSAEVRRAKVAADAGTPPGAGYVIQAQMGKKWRNLPVRMLVVSSGDAERKHKEKEEAQRKRREEKEGTKELGKLEKQRKQQERQKEAEERKSKQGDTKRKKKDPNTGRESSGTPTGKKERKRDPKKEKQPFDVVTTQSLLMTGARTGNVPDTSTAGIEPLPMPPVTTDALVMTGTRAGNVPDTSTAGIEPVPMPPVTTDALVMTGTRAVNLPDIGGSNIQFDVPTDQGCLQPGSRTSPIGLTLQVEHAFIGSALSEYAVADVDLLGHFTPRTMAGNFNSNFFSGAELMLQHAQLSPTSGDLAENYQQDTVTINPVWSGGARPILVFFDLDRVTNANQPRYCYLVTFSLTPTSASSSKYSLDFCVGRKLRREDWLCKPLELTSTTQAHIVSNVFTYDKYPVEAYSGYVDGEDVIRGVSNGENVPFLDLSGSDSVHFWLRGTGVVRFGEVKLFRIRLE